jgi:hypothetical protein
LVKFTHRSIASTYPFWCAKEYFSRRERRDERRRKEIESLADSSSAGVLRSASLIETGDERRRRKRKGRSESSKGKTRNNRKLFLPAAYKPGQKVPKGFYYSGGEMWTCRGLHVAQSSEVRH